MSKKHFEKVFTVGGVNLKLKKLGLAEFPAFKTIYATALSNADAEGVEKAYNMLFGWLEHEVLGEWVPVFDKKKGEFTIQVLNDAALSDQIISILLSDVLSPLFLNTVE